jgi:hypothetical protein
MLDNQKWIKLGQKMHSYNYHILGGFPWKIDQKFQGNDMHLFIIFV